MATNENPSAGTTPAEQRMLHVTLGIVFLALGTTFAIIMHNPVMGLPFFVLGIVYIVMGVTAAKAKAEKSPEE